MGYAGVGVEEPSVTEEHIQRVEHEELKLKWAASTPIFEMLSQHHSQSEESKGAEYEPQMHVHYLARSSSTVLLVALEDKA